jgi:hypothetical protein
MSKEHQALDFTAEEVVIPLNVGDKQYLLKELTGEDALAYKTAVAKCAKFNADGRMTQTVGLPDTQFLLVSLALYETSGSRVQNALAVVKAFRQKVVQKAFETILKVNNMAGIETLEDLKLERIELDERIKALEDREERLGNE